MYSIVRVSLVGSTSYLEFLQLTHNIEEQYVSQMQALRIDALTVNSHYFLGHVCYAGCRFNIRLDATKSSTYTWAHSRGDFCTALLHNAISFLRVDNGVHSFQHFETDLNDLSRKTEGRFQLADIKTMVDAVIVGSAVILCLLGSASQLRPLSY